MGRQRSPERDKAKALFLESGGELTPKEIAEQLGSANPDRVRKWKSMDKWQAALDEQNSRRRRGGQPGNRNAAGAGAPPGNTNAETHGAYTTVHFESLPEEVRNDIEAITLSVAAAMLGEVKLLMAKEYDLRERIRALYAEDPAELYVDKVIEMEVPAGENNISHDGEESAALKTAMQTTIKASPFDRAMKLETVLDKTHGRIIKALDSVRAYEADQRRATLEERKHRFNKQRVTGEYRLDPSTGEVDDLTDDENDDES